MIYRFISITLFITISFYSNAQIFDRIINDVVNDVIDHVAEKAAEEIANKIVLNITNKFDESLRESYEKDTTKHKKYPTYESYLTSMNKNANVPPKFEFDITMDIEVKDNNDISEMRMYFSKSNEIFGMETLDGNESLIIMDIENDYTVLYAEDEDGNKTAQAIPAFNTLAKWAIMSAEDNTEETEDFKLEKTGKIKTILGYKCVEYKGNSEDGSYKMYLAKDFPLSWEDSYYGSWTQYMSADKKKKYPIEKDAGMMLLMKSKSSDGDKSSWEVTEIVKEKVTINNSEYKFK